MKHVVSCIALIGLLGGAGCAQITSLLPGKGGGVDTTAPLDATARPGAQALEPDVAEVVTAPPPSEAARTADEFDTTTDAQRTMAEARPDPAAEQRLGETVASLGDPTQAGLWIKSPLVKTAGSGRIENPANGKSVQVELIPLAGADTAGSQVSLAALRLLEAPLTDLATLIVYAK